MNSMHWSDSQGKIVSRIHSIVELEHLLYLIGSRDLVRPSGLPPKGACSYPADSDEFLITVATIVAGAYASELRMICEYICRCPPPCNFTDPLDDIVSAWVVRSPADMVCRARELFAAHPENRFVKELFLRAMTMSKSPDVRDFIQEHAGDSALEPSFRKFLEWESAPENGDCISYDQALLRWACDRAEVRLRDGIEAERSTRPPPPEDE